MKIKNILVASVSAVAVMGLLPSIAAAETKLKGTSIFPCFPLFRAGLAA